MTLTTMRQAVVHINRVFPMLIASKTDYNEVRVTVRGLTKERQEAIAYYTDDIMDAVNTAAIMATELDK
jgi:hypothetical protein